MSLKVAWMFFLSLILPRSSGLLLSIIPQADFIQLYPPRKILSLRGKRRGMRGNPRGETLNEEAREGLGRGVEKEKSYRTGLEMGAGKGGKWATSIVIYFTGLFSIYVFGPCTSLSLHFVLILKKQTVNINVFTVYTTYCESQIQTKLWKDKHKEIINMIYRSHAIKY